MTDMTMNQFFCLLKSSFQLNEEEILPPQIG